MNEKISELENQLKKQSRNSLDALIIIKSLAWEYIRDLDFIKAKLYTDELLMLSEKLNNKEGSSEAHFYLGRIFVNFYEFDNALSHYLEALNIINESGETTGLANIYTELGNLYFKNLNYPKALEYYLLAKENAEKNNLCDFIGFSFNNLALIYNQMKEYDKALEYLKKSKIILETENKESQLGFCLLNIAELYLEKKDLSEVNVLINQAIDLFEKLDDKEGLSFAYILKGKYYLQKKEIICTDEYYQKAYSYALGLDKKDQLIQVYREFSDFYLSQADYKQAYDYYKLHIDLKNVLFNETTQLQIAKMQSIYDVELKKKEAEILRLKTEELKEAVRDAEIAYKKLEEVQSDMIKMEKKNAVLAMAVTANHEINQPLMIIKGAKDLLEMNLEECLSDKDHNLLKKMDKAILRIQEILNKFSSVNKLSFITYASNTEMLNINAQDWDE